MNLNPPRPVLVVIDLQSGWRSGDGSGDVLDRNTELVERLPEGWSTTAGREGVRSDLLP